MTLKPGYKQTEVGAIPSEWVLEYVEELAHITTGSRNTQDRVDEGLYPFFVRSQTIERINSYSFDGEAVLTAGDGVGTGKVFHYIDGKFDTHQRVYRISDFSARVNGYYFYLYFSSHFYSRIMQMTAKSSVDSVRREMIARMLIPLPTKAEQDAIAEALRDADALIESLEQLVVKKRQIKKGAMQELLTGRKRLPGFSGQWEVKRLGDMAEIVMGQSPSSRHYNNRGEGLPLIQGNADIKARKTIRRVFTTEITKRGYCGDIVMSVRAPVGEIAYAAFDVCLGRGVCAIRYPNNFLYHALVAKEPTWARLAKGSTFGSVNSTDVNALAIEMPRSRNEQSAVAAVLNDMDLKSAALEEKLAKARQIKQGMMQELLTGRVRLV
jgi:type I restriction enzyme S subunit